MALLSSRNADKSNGPGGDLSRLEEVALRSTLSHGIAETMPERRGPEFKHYFKIYLKLYGLAWLKAGTDCPVS